MSGSRKVPVFKVEFGQRVRHSLFKGTLVHLGPISNHRGQHAFWSEKSKHVLSISGTARVTAFEDVATIEGALLLSPDE